jgi:F-type H+-transporting ATPase subunit b
VGSVLAGLGIDATFVAQVINFIVLFILLRWLVYPSLLKILAERRERVAKALTDAESERQEAVRLKEQHLAELQGARAEAQAVIDRAQRVAQDQAKSLLEEARAQAERQRQSVAEEIARERDAAIAELRNEVADLVIAATSKLVRARMNEAADRELVQEFIGDLGQEKP